MTKVALPLASFIVGACCASLALSLIQTSTRVQAAPQGSLFRFRGAEPIVPPLGGKLERIQVAGGVQPLDGMNCESCLLAPDKFTYAGGAFRFNNAQLSRNIPIELKGAALNTLNLLRALGALPNPVPKPKPKIEPPNIKLALELKAQGSFTLVSLEGLKQ